MGDFDNFFHGSTQKILSLVKNLPQKDALESALRNLEGAPAKKERTKRRFNKHPRKLDKSPSEESRHAAPSLHVLKKPPEKSEILTDSSDEYCDVTVRKDYVQLHEDEDIDISDKILQDVQNGLTNTWMKFERQTGRNERAVKLVEGESGDCERVERVGTGLKPRASQKEMEEGSVVGPLKLYVYRKLSGIIEKSSRSLDDIKNLMESGGDAPDGDEDEEKRKKRSMEFSNRFSRIHLYEINRHIGDIQNMLRNRNSGQSNELALNQRFFSVHHKIYQALQAYQKHLPGTTTVGVPEKLKELLKSAHHLCQLYKDNSSGDDNEYTLIHAGFESKCKFLLDDENDMCKASKQSGLPKTNAVKSSATGIASVKAKNPKKFSMYTVPIRNDVYWKRAVAYMSQKKFDVPSKYKTATYKHRPPPDAKGTGDHKNHVFPCRSHKLCTDLTDESKPAKRLHPRCKTRAPKIAHLNDIDNVTTLLQTEDKDGNGDTAAPSEVMWNLADEFFRKINKGDESMSQSEYECILQHFIAMVNEPENGVENNKIEYKAQVLLERKLGKTIESMSFKEFVDSLLECVNGPHVEKKEPEIDKTVNGGMEVEPILGSTEKPSSKEKKQTITVSGAKNAQLICIHDETSLVEPHEQESSASQMRLTKNTSKFKIADETNELIYRERSDIDMGGRCKRIAQRNLKALRQLEMLPKQALLNIIQYKLDFHKATKDNYMYQKSGNMSPWILTERISDILLEEVLQSVARDMQVDEILQKIYAHEFT